MDILFHILRYTPFWAVPIIMICCQFAYIYWLKSIRRVAYGFMGIAGVCFITLVYYYWAGGPELAVKKLVELM